MAPARKLNLDLGVITHVPHWVDQDGKPLAYEPYVRELDIWAKIFSRVYVCAPRAQGTLVGNQARYQSENIVWLPVNYSMGMDKTSQLKRLIQLPSLVVKVALLVLRCDLIHLRSPGHPALFGNLIVRLLRRPSVTKWAGLFDAFEGERLPSRLERHILNHFSENHPVLVYGPSNNKNVISFIPALMSEHELVTASKISEMKVWDPPWCLLSVGRLSHVKGFDLAIRGLGELNRRRPDLRWEYVLVGDGKSADYLRNLALECGISHLVTFTGALPFAEAQNQYAKAHVVIMPGTKEGWPKVIAETWAHSAIPLAASAGLVPWILQESDSGIQFEPTPEDLATKLIELLDKPEQMKFIAKNMADRATSLSLECFETRLLAVLDNYCGLGVLKNDG